MPSFGFFLLSMPKDRCGGSKHCSSPRDKAPQQAQEPQRLLAKDTVPSVTSPALVMLWGEEAVYWKIIILLCWNRKIESEEQISGSAGWEVPTPEHSSSFHGCRAALDIQIMIIPEQLLV